MEEETFAPSSTSGDEAGLLLGGRRTLTRPKCSLVCSQERSSWHLPESARILGLSVLVFFAVVVVVALSIGGSSGRRPAGKFLVFKADADAKEQVSAGGISIFTDAIMSKEELQDGSREKQEDVVVGVGDGHIPTVVTEQCVWHTCGVNTVCRLYSDDRTVDGHNSTVLLNSSTIRECKQKCEEQGEDKCKGVEFNNNTGRCELWSRPILSHRSCITGHNCPEAHFSCHTMQCKAIDRPTELRAEERSFKDWFGRSVDISGDTAVVGASGDNDRGSYSGAAYVFVRRADHFVEQAKLTADDGYREAYLGNSVSVSGEVVLVGAYRDSYNKKNSGSAYIFRRDIDVWNQESKIVPDDSVENQHFGYRVSIFGDTALIVAGGDAEHNISGAAYVFVHKDNSWVQTAKLTAPAGNLPSNFGTSIGLSADTVMIGAEEDDTKGHSTGVVYVFTRNASTWSQTQRVVAHDTGDHFGSSISVSGNTSFIGAYTSSAKGKDSGAVYVFVRHGENWKQHQKLVAEDSDADDGFGHNVDVAGNTAVIGAYRDEHRGIDRSGSGYIFVRTGSKWVQQSKLAPAQAKAGAQFGHVASISGSMAAFATLTDQAWVFPATLTQACPSTG